MVADASVDAGTSAADVQLLRVGQPPTNDHNRSSRLPSRACRATVARALAMVAVTLARLRTIPGSASRRSTSPASKPATTSGSKPAKTWR